jgi:hypothetical protein
MNMGSGYRRDYDVIKNTLILVYLLKKNSL